MDIPAQLRLMRTVKGQTLSDVAAGTGLSISYLSDLERGRTNPSIETLEKIAVFHNMELFISFVGDVPDAVRVSIAKLEELQGLIKGMLGQNDAHN